MAVMIGRNQNMNDNATVTTIEINSSTATVIAGSNASRIYIGVSLDFGTSDIDALIRLYPAAADNNKAGFLLTRRTGSNDALFNPFWEMMPDNTYTGEISAISASGTFNLHITEY